MRLEGCAEGKRGLGCAPGGQVAPAFAGILRQKLRPPLSRHPRPRFWDGLGWTGLEPRDRNTPVDIPPHAPTHHFSPIYFRGGNSKSKASSPAPPTPRSSALVCAHLGPLSEFPVGALGSSAGLAGAPGARAGLPLGCNISLSIYVLPLYHWDVMYLSW